MKKYACIFLPLINPRAWWWQCCLVLIEKKKDLVKKERKKIINEMELFNHVRQEMIIENENRQEILRAG